MFGDLSHRSKLSSGLFVHIDYCKLLYLTILYSVVSAASLKVWLPDCPIDSSVESGINFQQLPHPTQWTIRVLELRDTVVNVVTNVDTCDLNHFF